MSEKPKFTNSTLSVRRMASVVATLGSPSFGHDRDDGLHNNMASNMEYTKNNRKAGDFIRNFNAARRFYTNSTTSQPYKEEYYSRLDVALRAVQTPLEKARWADDQKEAKARELKFTTQVNNVVQKSPIFFEVLMRGQSVAGSGARPITAGEIFGFHDRFVNNNPGNQGMKAFADLARRCLADSSRVTSEPERDRLLGEFAEAMFGSKWRYYVQAEIAIGVRKISLLDQLKLKLPLPVLDLMARTN